MKKMWILICSLIAVFVLSSAVVFAAKHHDSNPKITTISEIKANSWDEQRVLLDGEFTEHVYKDIYIFTDDKGDFITVDIDDEVWYQLSMNSPVRIFAKVDKDWYGEIELDVEHIEKR